MMVSRSTYDTEHAARVEAEKQVAVLQGKLELVTAQLRAVQQDLRDAHARHERELSVLVDKISKPDPVIPEQPDNPYFLTSAQLLTQPAIGKRGLAQRQLDINAALLREAQEKGEHQVDTQNAVLTDGEKQLLEKQLEAAQNDGI